MNPENLFWHKFTIALPPQFEEEASARLVALGSNGVWVEEENGTIYLNVFFPGILSKDIILKSIRNTLHSLIPDKPLSINSEEILEERWQTEWQRHSIPVQKIGKKLLIIPPWEKRGPTHSTRKVICLSPGMAFGTGTHPTTRSCLLFLEGLISKKQKGPMLDVGTGSGILAIGAIKLGVDRVTAVEIDPVALRVARDNARSNRVLSKTTFRDSIPTPRKFPIVVANLTAPLLIEHDQALTIAVSKRGNLILSGMLKGTHREIRSRYQKSFNLVKTKFKEGWVTLLLKKK